MKSIFDYVAPTMLRARHLMQCSHHANDIQTYKGAPISSAAQPLLSRSVGPTVLRAPKGHILCGAAAMKTIFKHVKVPRRGMGDAAQPLVNI